MTPIASFVTDRVLGEGYNEQKRKFKTIKVLLLNDAQNYCFKRVLAL